MGNNNLSENENILVKVDQNNLIYIDPNSVITNDGNVLPRGVNQENLVMYVNLEADLVPRSILVAENDKNTLTSIAQGTLNFLKNSNGSDYDSTWTDAYTEKTENGKNINFNLFGVSTNIKVGNGTFYQNDSGGQSFGIDSVSISVKGTNFIPQVNINFIDVRGKTLFESAENSPYSAFFHIPWPIFYLTVKGFYGKAIRYRLHLVKFNTKFNETNGNFEVSTTFVGSTYAYLNDIPLKGILNAPYMYMVENVVDKKTNNKTGQTQKKVSKSSRGYSILKTVYSEMKQKNLIPQNFPVKTLREVLVISETLDKILEQKIFGEVASMKLFVGVRKFEETIVEFENAVHGWKSTYLSKKTHIIPQDTNTVYYELSDKKKDDPKDITGKDDSHTLESIIKTRNILLKKQANLTNETLKENINRTSSKFTIEKLITKNFDNINDYYKKDGTFFYVAIDKLVNDIREIKKTFESQKNILQSEVEKQMNDVIINDKSGIGFEPTIRNVFAVILANAEVYIRLMKETHKKAFDVSNERKEYIKSVSNENKGDKIYPWPEIKKKVSGGKENVIAYPGDPTLIKQLHTDEPNLWPEIEFIENFIGVTTNKYDTNSEKEGGQNNITYVFENDVDNSKFNKISSLSTITENGISDDILKLPYIDKTPSSFLYEIWERAKIFTLFDSFNDETLTELAKKEFENIQESIKEDDELRLLLKDKIINEIELRNNLELVSPHEKYPYYQDNLPTTPYLINTINYPIKIEKYVNLNTPRKNSENYPQLINNLINYTPEPYRKNIYPFNSSLYLSYIDKEKFNDDEFKFRGILNLNIKEGFISSPINPNAYVNNGYNTNLFTQNLELGNIDINILNTSYFHNQLYSDFTKVGSYGKYVGSSYLLINSLPFLDLEDNISFDGQSIRLSSLFREIGSTHFIPYHLIVKWGSIYHRYKKFLIDGIDILDGSIDSNNNVLNIDSSLFFDNNTNDTFNIGVNDITYTGSTDVGIHPFYDAVYHEVINGYNHYDVLSGSTSFESNVISGKIKERLTQTINGLNYWTGFVDNSKFSSDDSRYTLLPCDGNNLYNDKKIINNVITINNDNFNRGQQIYFRTIWEDQYINDDFSGKTFPSYSEYNKDINGVYGLSTNYKKVIDLIGTFSPIILEEFEDIFLQFATEKGKDEIPYKKYSGVTYDNFQELLKDISSVKKETTDPSDIGTLIETLKNKQTASLKNISNIILETKNLLKVTIGNPKELDDYLFRGFTNLDTTSVFTFGSHNISQETVDNLKLIKLYIGEDIDNYYKNFFDTNDIELNEENIIQFRPLVLIYGGYIKSGGVNTKEDFQKYIIDNIFIKDKITTKTTTTESKTLQVEGSSGRFSYFLNALTKHFNGLNTLTNVNDVTIISGYNNDDLKVELYQYFKSFNDKWVAGNSIGQRLLLEEFLFLDKANKDIGDKVYLSLDRLLGLNDSKNHEANLYGVISMILQGTGLDMRALPAYINFYGTNYNNKSKITPSKKVAKNIFGTFLDVDYQDSSPKIIIQLVAQSSKHLADLENNKKYIYSDDGFNISNVNNNPLIITTPEVFNTGDLSKSNKVVAFEVSFGDQNQSIFKGVQLDQSTIRNTTESFVVLENIAKSESGSGAYNVDIGLFEYYRQASYSCEVTCMGNVMIQPTMFFYLKNIPMFKGSYWITEVNHNIRNNNITTTFKGSRIPYASLPDPNDFFVSSYRVLFDRIMNVASSKQNIIDNLESTEIKIGQYTINPGELTTGEDMDTFTKDSGLTIFGVPYNGYGGEKFIQKIKSEKGGTYLRAHVAQMGGPNYPIDPTTTMGIVGQLNGVDKLPWSEISNKSKTNDFFSCKFQISSKCPASKIITGKTTFINPKREEITKTISYSLTGVVGDRIPTGQINVGPNVDGYGIGMSYKLMNYLGLNDGDVVYFNID